MSFAWILSPITQYSVLALGILSCVGHCFSNSLQIHAERRRMAASQESLERSVGALHDALGQIRRDMREPQARYLAPSPGLNLTTRFEALRMHRRGESLATISTALQTPRNEIELLVKVHGHQNL